MGQAPPAGHLDPPPPGSALDERRRKLRSVDEDFIAETKGKVIEAATALRTGAMPPRPEPKKCGACDHRRMCSAGAAATG